MTAVLNPPPALGALNLADLPRVTADYLRTKVEVRIPRVARGLQSGDNGSLTVRVRNADESTGIRLEDVTVHLEVARPAVLELSADVATILEAREGGSRSDPLLPSDALVPSMFVFFPQPGTIQPDDVLEPGEEIEFDVEYHAHGAGTTDITAHVHATVSTEALFPRGESEDDLKTVQIVS